MALHSGRTCVQVDGSIMKIIFVDNKTNDIGIVTIKMDLGTNSLVCKESFKPNTYINYYLLSDIVAQLVSNLVSNSV